MNNGLFYITLKTSHLTIPIFFHRNSLIFKLFLMLTLFAPTSTFITHINFKPLTTINTLNNFGFIYTNILLQIIYNIKGSKLILP